MTEKQFVEIHERYATLPSVGVPSQVRADFAACISEIARVGAPFEPEPKTDEEIAAEPEPEPTPRHTSGARKK